MTRRFVTSLLARLLNALATTPPPVHQHASLTYWTSFEEHRPRRGDDVEAWLLRQRDAWYRTGDRPEFRAIDGMLDRYRECSDYGLTLRPEDDERGD